MDHPQSTLHCLDMQIHWKIDLPLLSLLYSAKFASQNNIVNHNKKMGLEKYRKVFWLDLCLQAVPLWFWVSWAVLNQAIAEALQLTREINNTVNLKNESFYNMWDVRFEPCTSGSTLNVNWAKFRLARERRRWLRWIWLVIFEKQGKDSMRSKGIYKQ